MKWLHLVLTIISAAAFVGSLIAMYFLVQIGAAINAMFTADLSSIAIDPTFLRAIADQFNTILFWGWLWVIIVFVASLYGVWNGWKALRSK